MIWLDGLDIPQVQFFGSTFGETSYADVFENTLPPGTNSARFGRNMLAMDDHPQKLFSPLFTYPFKATHQALEKLIQSRNANPWHGYKMEYKNPMDGSPVMPTLSAFLSGMQKQFGSRPYQTTEHQVFSVIKGSGKILLGDGTEKIKI